MECRAHLDTEEGDNERCTSGVCGWVTQRRGIMRGVPVVWVGDTEEGDNERCTSGVWVGDTEEGDNERCTSGVCGWVTYC